MSEILFHPQLEVAEAARIAEGQGGRLVWSRGRIRLVKALDHAGCALSAVRHDDYTAALQHIRAARYQIGEVCPCSA